VRRRNGELLRIYRALRRRFGPQGWWPGETPLEVIVGAILTQNTAWGNVERAIANLKEARLLSVRGLARVSRPRLARLVRPSGYFNQKAAALKAFSRFLARDYGGILARMGREPTAALRRKLLEVRGIGPETADSILLYAFDRPVFVVDAYTARVLSRHGIAAPRARYGDLQRLIAGRIPHRRTLYNEFHALFVRVGKEFCRKTPRCAGCPLKDHSPRRTRRGSAGTRIGREGTRASAFSPCAPGGPQPRGRRRSPA
jgi:endonuclease-3 related protein